MTQRKSNAPRKKRRFRPLRRVLLLATAGLLAFGLVRTATLAYSLVFGDRVQLSRAEEIAINPVHLGVGVILKDEVVVVASRPGTVNAMVQSATDVSAGDEILELVDRDRLAEIERLIAAEEAKQEGSGADGVVVLADAESALRKATQSLRDLTAAYALALRDGDVSQAASLFPEITTMNEQVYGYAATFQLALEVNDEIGSRYEELLEQRATAIHKVVAPVSGIVSWVVDEVSGTATPNVAPAVALELIANRRPETGPLASGTHVAGGSSMCAVVDPASITLVLEMKDPAWTPDEQIQVRINGEDVDADFWKFEPLADQTALYYFRFISVTDNIVDSRWVDVEIWPVQEAAFSVPASSLTRVAGVPALYAVDENGKVFAIEVNVMEENSTNAIVTGLPGEIWIVSTTTLVVEGDTVARPKGE